MRLAPRPNGFIVLEMLGGLLLIGAVTTLFVVALNRRQQVDVRLTEQRASIRRAEAVLLDLDARAPTTCPADVAIRAVATPAPANFRWVEVSVSSAGHPIRLVGLVPASPEVP